MFVVISTFSSLVNHFNTSEIFLRQSYSLTVYDCIDRSVQLLRRIRLLWSSEIDSLFFYSQQLISVFPDGSDIKTVNSNVTYSHTPMITTKVFCPQRKLFRFSSHVHHTFYCHVTLVQVGVPLIFQVLLLLLSIIRTVSVVYRITVLLYLDIRRASTSMIYYVYAYSVQYGSFN